MISQASVILKLLCAIVYGDPALAADELVIGAFVGILKSAPPTYVIDEYGLEIGIAGAHIVYKFLQRKTAFELQTALARVFVGPDDLEAAPRRILRDDFRLVLGGIFLVLRRHAHILRRPDQRSFMRCFSSFFARPHRSSALHVTEK